jgi:hypothetical protein
LDHNRILAGGHEERPFLMTQDQLLEPCWAAGNHFLEQVSRQFRQYLFVKGSLCPSYLTCPEWRFYEADFVKTRCKNSLWFIFCSFLPTSDNNSPFGFGA